MKHILPPLILLATAFGCVLSLSLRVRAFEQLDTYCFQLWEGTGEQTGAGNGAIPSGVETLTCADWPEKRIRAYHTEPGGRVIPEARYRKVDLEDAFDRETARKIRAVMSSSYPVKDPETLQLQANAWLRDQGEAQLEGLRRQEITEAVQKALFAAVSGEDAAAAEDPETAFSGRNARLLYGYLRNLETEAASYDTVGDGTFTAAQCRLRREADGSDTMLVRVTLETTVSRQDSLTLCVTCGARSVSQFIFEAGEYELELPNADASEEVLVQLAGKQYSSDTALFLPQNPKSASLIGFDSGLYPVYAVRRLTPPFEQVSVEPEPEGEAGF